MKNLFFIIADSLHMQLRRFKTGALWKPSMKEIYELGVVLVLVESGQIKTREDALELGVNGRVAAVLGRLLDGEDLKEIL